jgi:hypothetical protein
MGHMEYLALPDAFPYLQAEPLAGDVDIFAPNHHHSLTR